MALDLLTLVSTTQAGDEALRRQRVHGTGARDIVRLCGQICSVAEIGATLEVSPLVVQVLLEDLDRDGFVALRPPPDVQRPSVDFLERVLHGLVGP